MTGSATEASFLDKFGFPNGFCELRSTRYTISQSKVRGCEFVETLPVNRTDDEKRLLFNLAATCFSDLFTPEVDLNDAVLHPASLDDSADVSNGSIADITTQSLSLRLTKDRLHHYLSKFLLSYFLVISFIFYFCFKLMLMVIILG